MTAATPEQIALVRHAIEARIVRIDAPADVIAAAGLSLLECEATGKVRPATCMTGKNDARQPTP